MSAEPWHVALPLDLCAWPGCPARPAVLTHRELAGGGYLWYGLCEVHRGEPTSIRVLTEGEAPPP